LRGNGQYKERTFQSLYDPKWMYRPERFPAIRMYRSGRSSAIRWAGPKADSGRVRERVQFDRGRARRPATGEICVGRAQTHYITVLRRRPGLERCKWHREYWLTKHDKRGVVDTDQVQGLEESKKGKNIGVMAGDPPESKGSQSRAPWVAGWHGHEPATQWPAQHVPVVQL
jgi:hypothetical protein